MVLDVEGLSAVPADDRAPWQDAEWLPQEGFGLLQALQQVGGRCYPGQHKQMEPGGTGGEQDPALLFWEAKPAVNLQRLHSSQPEPGLIHLAHQFCLIACMQTLPNAAVNSRVLEKAGRWHW